ncbi:class I SAM-dependent methyltransferase [Angustibacter sp. McL0619]|uniref:class I SAM-dependent methyltransferase n=1 Tax=Angustibacter sp. McL0619 TaxID=3415676 RepID=UPI003CEBAEB6
MTGDETYVYRQSWEQERARLAGLSAQFDPGTKRHLRTIGVASGWRCWEVGAGAGSIAAWLADEVGETGHVLVTDLDTRFVEELAGDHVQVLRHDLTGDELPEGEFDLIHARAVLEHLPSRERTLRRLVGRLRPDGVLFLEDVVFGGTHLSLSLPMISPAAAAGLLSRVQEAVAGAFRSVGADPEYGMLLPERLIDAGLQDVNAELSTLLTRGGTDEAQFYRLSIAELGERLVEHGLLDQVDRQTIDELLNHEDTRWPSVAMMSAWGRRP